jgi:hypothetical protein
LTFSTVTVTWDESDVALNGLNGYITFQLTAPLIDQASGEVAEPEPAATFFFAGGTGQSTPLVANDSAGAVPTGTAYRVTVAVDGSQPYSFISQILAAAGATQTLGDLQANAAVPVTQFSQFLPLTGADMLGWLAPNVVPVTVSGGVIAVNALAGNAFDVTLTAPDTTVAAPANPSNAQVLRYRIISNGFQVTWDAIFDFAASGSPPVLAAGLNILAFEFAASIGRWCSLNTPGLGF